MKTPAFLMTSTRGAPSGASISRPLRVSLANALPDAVPLDRQAYVERLLVRARCLLAVGVRPVVAPQVLLRHLRQPVLVTVDALEVVGGVVEGAAGLDRLVGASLDAEAAVHAQAHVDLVAFDVIAAVQPRAGLDEDAAVGAGLGAGGAAGAALLEPEEVGAGVDGDGADLLRVLGGEGRAEQGAQGHHHPFGDTGPEQARPFSRRGRALSLPDALLPAGQMLQRRLV